MATTSDWEKALFLCLWLLEFGDEVQLFTSSIDLALDYGGKKSGETTSAREVISGTKASLRIVGRKRNSCLAKAELLSNTLSEYWSSH